MAWNDSSVPHRTIPYRTLANTVKALPPVVVMAVMLVEEVDTYVPDLTTSTKSGSLDSTEVENLLSYHCSSKRWGRMGHTSFRR